uniref:Hypothetical chloroplast RF88 n=1 Tax=Amicula sp. isolate GU52X-4 cfCalB7 TaxID=3003489 RepID=A0A9E9C5Q4_9STRA|nr:hypothetical chloroplast RF88 [Amicula sp. isolate GU52X-4 cfCalB7]
MNQIPHVNRCKCNKKLVVTKKRKSIIKSEGKVFQYPKPDEIISKTFHIKYKKKLSPTGKLLLNSFQNKYIYYAIDDILYSFKLDSAERKSLLTILYSSMISLQNNFSVNFFDIWIREIYIDEISKNNKFLKTNSQTSKQFSSIIIKFFYKTSVPVKKRESLW